VEELQAIGRTSIFTCPDCGGVLFELNDKHPVRYRCHTGHAFSLRSLASTQEEVSDAALWTSLRTLQEKEAILATPRAGSGAERFDLYAGYVARGRRAGPGLYGAAPANTRRPAPQL
jgi:hypothetical protein